MTPKEKATELVNKSYLAVGDIYDVELGINSIIEQKSRAKKCALICVDYVSNETRPDEGFIYWQKVKQEIEKL